MPDKTDKEKEADTQWDARLAAHDHSQERQAAIKEVVTAAISKTTAEMTAKFMAMLNEVVASMPVS